MRFCSKCVQSDSRPGITLDDEGVCLPCRVAEQRDSIDWAARRAELDGIAEWGRTHGNGEYDCIVAVSGGKDSTRQALIARDELNLKVLCVSCVGPPEMQTEVGADNLANLIGLGFDTLSMGPAPQKWKRLMRRAFDLHGNYCKSTERALYATPARFAIRMGVPLVFLGENNALTYGDVMAGDGGEGNDIKNNNTLSGGRADELLDDDLTERDLIAYNFPTDEEMAEAGVRIVYLGYFIKDFNNFKNAEVARANGLKGRDVKREDIGAINMFDALDEDFVHVNQFLKYLKLGFGKTSDEVCEAIRLGRMTRDEAIDLVRRFDGRVHDRYVRKFCSYLGMTREEFEDIAESFRNADLWTRDEDGEWRLKNTLWKTNY